MDLVIDPKSASAFYVDSPPAKSRMTPALCAPEIVLGLPFNYKIDIWAAGCTMYSLITRSSLFGLSAEFQSDEEAARDEHLLQMTLAIGPLPQCLLKKWHVKTDDGRKGLYPRQRWVHSSIEDSIRRPVILGLVEQEKEYVLQVLRHMLEYNPFKRYSAKRLLELPWLRDPPGWQRSREELRNDYEGWREKEDQRLAREERKQKLLQKMRNALNERKRYLSTRKKIRWGFRTRRGRRAFVKERRLEVIDHIYPDPGASGSIWRNPFLWHAGR